MFSSWFFSHAGGRPFKSYKKNINEFLKSLNLKIQYPLVLDFNYNAGVISKNKKFKTILDFLFHVLFSNYVRPHADEVS